MFEAIHFGVTVPVPGWQLALVLERVHLRKLGHVRPVDATHVLPPANDLTDKSFHLVDRDLVLALAVLRHDSLYHLERRNLLAVERKTDTRVKEVGIAHGHRVLVGPEKVQSPLDEVLQGYDTLFPGNWPLPALGVNTAHSDDTLLSQHRDERLDLVLERNRIRHVNAFGNLVAIVLIEVPRAPLGIALIID